MFSVAESAVHRVPGEVEQFNISTEFESVKDALPNQLVTMVVIFFGCNVKRVVKN